MRFDKVQDQIIGLNAWAKELVDQTETVVEVGRVETITGDWIENFERKVQRKVQNGVVKTPSGNKYSGSSYGEEYCLNKYTFVNGRVLEEFLQAAPWDSGPCFFLALKDKNGEKVLESLWTDEQIDARRPYALK
jgi:hypothetical protein